MGKGAGESGDSVCDADLGRLTPSSGPAERWSGDTGDPPDAAEDAEEASGGCGASRGDVLPWFCEPCAIENDAPRC